MFETSTGYLLPTSESNGSKPSGETFGSTKMYFNAVTMINLASLSNFVGSGADTGSGILKSDPESRKIMEFGYGYNIK
jgi:hypothetical protein